MNFQHDTKQTKLVLQLSADTGNHKMLSCTAGTTLQYPKQLQTEMNQNQD